MRLFLNCSKVNCRGLGGEAIRSAWETTRGESQGIATSTASKEIGGLASLI